LKPKCRECCPQRIRLGLFTGVQLKPLEEVRM